MTAFIRHFQSELLNRLEIVVVLWHRWDKWINRGKAGFNQQTVLGHNEFQYRVVDSWCKAEKESTPVNNCHEMQMDAQGHLILLTDHPKNNVIFFNSDGDVVKKWTLGSTGAHGLTLFKDNAPKNTEIEYLLITDYKTGQVIKTTLDGKKLLELPTPHTLKIYREHWMYRPTQTCVSSTGDIYVADGYGSQFIIQYDKEGNYIRHFGGKKAFRFAHGIAIDSRKSKSDQPETLLITSREECKFKRYSLDGEFISEIEIPGAYMCRAVIHKNNIYTGVCWSQYHLKVNSGFVTILDENDKVISNPGGSEPVYKDGKLQAIKQEHSFFSHCHDVCVDQQGNIFVSEWNAGRQYPVKLERLSS